MKRIFWGAALALLMALFAIPAFAEESWVGKPAIDFTVTDLSGKEITVSALKGKVVWLNFWGLRCGPCLRELPALEALYKKYSAQGLVIIGVNTDGVPTKEIAKHFAEREDLKNVKVTFPIVADEEIKIIDAYQLMGAPLNVMIDKAGVIQYYHEGYEDGDEKHYEEVLKSLLGK